MAQDVSLEIRDGVSTTSENHLDGKMPVVNDTERDLLITGKKVKQGHKIYHESDNKHYWLELYPTFGNLTGVKWSLLGNEKTDDETSTSTETVPSSFALSKVNEVVQVLNQGLILSDTNGIEKFKTNSLRFKNVIFNPVENEIEVPVSVRNTYYLDTNAVINTGVFQVPTRPFKTINEILTDMPNNIGKITVIIFNGNYDLSIQGKTICDIEFIGVSDAVNIETSNFNPDLYTKNQIFPSESNENRKISFIGINNLGLGRNDKIFSVSQNATLKIDAINISIRDMFLTNLARNIMYKSKTTSFANANEVFYTELGEDFLTSYEFGDITYTGSGDVQIIRQNENDSSLLSFNSITALSATTFSLVAISNVFKEVLFGDINIPLSGNFSPIVNVGKSPIYFKDNNTIIGNAILGGLLYVGGGNLGNSYIKNTVGFELRDGTFTCSALLRNTGTNKSSSIVLNNAIVECSDATALIQGLAFAHDYTGFEFIKVISFGKIKAINGTNIPLFSDGFADSTNYKLSYEGELQLENIITTNTPNLSIEENNNGKIVLKYN